MTDHHLIRVATYTRLSCATPIASAAPVTSNFNEVLLLRYLYNLACHDLIYDDVFTNVIAEP